MSAQLAPNALVDLQTVKDELGLSDSSSDALLSRRINAAAEAIEQFCRRRFQLALRTENLAIPSTLPPRIVLKAPPILAVQAIYENADIAPTLVSPTTYAIENAKAGIIYRKGRWNGTALRRGDIVQDYEPGSEMANLQVIYLSGFVGLPQALAAAARPADGASVALGTLLRIGTTPNELLWICTTAGVIGTGSPAGLSTPGALSTVGENGLVAGAQVTDGAAVWSYLGTVGAVGAGLEGTAVSLPKDLISAAVDTVVALWRNRGQDTSITSKTVSRASTTWDAQARALGIPPTAVSILMRYQRVVIG